MSETLKESVLVLNKNFLPIGTMTVEHALICLFREVVWAMDEDYNSYNLDQWLQYSIGKTRVIKTSKPFAVPDVVRVKNYAGTIVDTLYFSRENVLQRDQYICQYCARKMQREIATLDHIIPKCRKRDFNMTDSQINSWENVVAACKICNSTKDNLTPQEANMVLIRPPIKPKNQIRGLTPKKFKPIWNRYLKPE